jgi:lipopolysaccharide/colanic/teichoic acid biosynthesis glycosyltransferase
MTHRAQLVLKRVFDVVVSAALLIILSPLLVLIAATVRGLTGSPILYIWNVIGTNGRPIKGYKFRTMVQNADELKTALLDRNEMDGPVFKIKDDPRITPLGRWLRKFSLDELPQLWSVLKGDMSMVGPRPPLATEYAHFSDAQKRKLSVRPGMTSLWHVSGKPADFDEWVRLDLEYIEQWSFVLDLQILLKTTLVVLTGKNH